MRLKLVAAMEDADDGLANDASLCRRSHLGGYGEAVNIFERLHEFDLANEERGRLARATFRAAQGTGVGVDEDFALEQARILPARLQLINVHQAAIQLLRALVAELVVRFGDGAGRRIALLNVIDFRLEQPGDDVCLYEIIARELDGVEIERPWLRVVIADQFVLALLGRLRQLGLDQGVIRVFGKSLGLIVVALHEQLQGEFGRKPRQRCHRKVNSWLVRQGMVSARDEVEAGPKRSLSRSRKDG